MEKKNGGGVIVAPFIYADIVKQTHVLIAGATGCGKTTVLKNVLQVIDAIGAYKILIDPKSCELYRQRHNRNAIGYASTSAQALKQLQGAARLMRFRFLALRLGCSGGFAPVYVVIDELADLRISEHAAEITKTLQKLLQLARAVDIHIIACTQAPNRQIIPAALTLNFTARLGLWCNSAIESRQIIGAAGCESLPVHGVGLWLTPGEHVQRVEIPQHCKIEK